MSVPPSPEVTTGTSAAASDEAMLAELGYKQELHRGMSGFSNFAVSFSIISVLAGCITTLLPRHGRRWPDRHHHRLAARRARSCCCVALAMAEVCSVYPTAGGLYFWAGRLARRNKRVWAWYVGWFNFLGEVAVTAAIDYGAAVTWMALLNLVFGVEVIAGSTFVAFVVIIAAARAAQHLRRQPGQAALQRQRLVAPGRRRDHRARSSPSCRTSTSRLSWTFTHFENRTGWASAVLRLPHRPAHGAVHLHRATTPRRTSPRRRCNASTEAPKGIVRSVWVSILAGWVLLVAVTAAIQDYDASAGTDIGLPPAQIFIDAAGRSLGDLPALHLRRRPVLLRHGLGDGQLPDVLRLLARQRTARLAAVVPGQPAHRDADELHLAVRRLLDRADRSGAAELVDRYLAVTSIAVIGLYIAYVVPVFLRRRNPEFRPATGTSAGGAPRIGWMAVIWVGFIVILFMLPPAQPVTVNTFNYAPIAVLAVLVFSTVTWFAGGRRPLHA